ncbi:MAG: FKBP-type peptidyl-prolyl cis-trans isomerase [Candidatus Hodarchaeales archaeon]
MPVSRGDKIKVDYVGTLDDGTIFDSTKETGQPLKFIVGAGLFLDAFENSVIGMEIGEEKTIHLPPEEAYGKYNPNLIDTVSISSIPIKKDLHPGMLLVFCRDNGEEVPARIIELNDNEVELDMNHPLSGISLNYSIIVIDIISQRKRKL